MKSRELVFASSNTHKLEEAQRLLPSYQLKSLKEIGCDIEIPEDADSFEGNAFLKAKYVWDHYRLACFADDSGLVLPALNNAPGVYSARYAGPQRNDRDNILKLLQELEGKSDRSAYFITIICYYNGIKARYFEGKVEGEISLTMQGDKGFGYDPVFIPKGHQKSFAEMTLAQKNELSHRAKALEKLSFFLNTAN